MLKKPIKAYLSHYVRGKDGNKATEETVEANCAKAIEWSKKLRVYFGSNLDLYVPAAMDLFPRIALRKGYLNVDQILDIDCTIVSQCDILLIANWGDCISEGMRRELNTAKQLGIPYRVFTDIEYIDLKALEIWLEGL